MNEPTVLDIEEAAFRAWPAEEVVDLSGWRLRFMHGVTHRANCVWPNQWHGDASLEARLDTVERFYAARSMPPSFQLTAAARPANLDAALEARGYVMDSPVIVKTLELGAASKEGIWGVQATVGSRPSPDWLTVAVDRGRYAGVRDVFLRLLDRLGDRAGYGLALENGAPIAVGLGVADGPWLGIFGMLTLPEARRRGAARAILRALSSWGAARGARRAYLQVEKNNHDARSLYASAGFAAAYEYHYRTKRLTDRDRLTT